MTSKRPNILFIVLDTLRRDRLGVYGYLRETSPHLDAFAAQATRFERAIAPAQWTLPSHASMFTGVFPSVHGVTQSNSLLSEMQPTAAEILRVQGYHTAAFCNNPLVGVLNHGLQRGFSEFYNYASAVPQRPNETARSDLYRAFMSRFRPFARGIGNQFARNDGLFRAALNPFWVPIWSKYINFKGSTANSIADLMDYWRAYAAGGAEQPLFVFLNLMQSHLPFHPPQDYVDRVAPALRSDRRAYQFMGRFNADGAAWASPPDPPLADWQQRVLSDFYDAEIAFQDDHLGRLLRMLSEGGALDNTVVIITADHGEGLGDHGLMGHGFTVHQELVHVPLIIRGADHVPFGGVVHQNVSTRRIFHTLLDVAGLMSQIGSSEDEVHNLSLLRAITGNDAEDDTAFTEAIPPSTFVHVIEHRSPAVLEKLRLRLTRRGVYDGDYKLMVTGETAEGLYHVAADLPETHNLLLAEPGRAAALMTKLEGFVHSLQDHQAGSEAHQNVSDEVLDQLRALGYVD